MGIDGFKQLFCEQKSEVKWNNLHGIYSHSQFSGDVVAVDAGTLTYKLMSPARKEVVAKTQLRTEIPDENKIFRLWIKKCLDFLERNFLAKGILPILVMDGPPHPAKMAVIEERSEKKQSHAERILGLQVEIAEFEDPADIPQEKIDEYKSLLNNYLQPRGTQYEQLKEVVRAFGIPVIQAKHDAEKTCCRLVKAGIACAVFSTDSDVLPYGSPLWLKKDTPQGFEGVQLNDAMDELEMDFKEFVDTCIGVGCDWNVRMKGYGPAKIRKLMKEYRSIDNFPEKLPIECLRHEVCREIFFSETLKESCDGPINTRPDYEALEEAHQVGNLYGISPNLPSVFLSHFHKWEELKKERESNFEFVSDDDEFVSDTDE